MQKLAFRLCGMFAHTVTMWPKAIQLTDIIKHFCSHFFSLIFFSVDWFSLLWSFISFLYALHFICTEWFHQLNAFNSMLQYYTRGREREWKKWKNYIKRGSSNTKTYCSLFFYILFNSLVLTHCHSHFLYNSQLKCPQFDSLFRF